MKVFAPTLAALGSLAALPATAACHLALALALDVSTSVDEREYALQRDGLAAALNSHSVRSALFSGPDTVALAVYEWSGRLQQTLVLDWVEITSPDALAGVIVQISNAQRSFDDFPTAMGHALTFGAALLDRAPVCERNTIDISGDGYNNDGLDPPAAYREFDFGHITVNGLVVRNSDHRVPIYYANEVIHGADAFIEVADGYLDFENAMRRKLVREIGVVVLGGQDQSTGGNEG